MNATYARTVFAVVRKDLRTELRSRELVATMLIFALLSVLIFSLALELDRIARQEAVSGVLWVTVAFASLLGLNRSMASEREMGNMDALLMAPIPRTAILLGKLLGNFIFTGIVGLILLFVMTILYDMVLLNLPMLGLLAIGILGLATVGTLLSTMTAQTRAREALLPVVMLPMALPIVVAVVRTTTGILSGAPVETWIAWPQMVLATDVIYLVLSFILFDYVIEE